MEKYIAGDEAQSEGVEAPPEGRWVPLRQAAEAAGVHIATVRRWVKSGKIPGELVEGKFGPEWHVDTEAMYSANLVRQEPRPGTAALPTLDMMADLIAAKEEAAELRARLSFLTDLPKQLEASNEREHELTKELAEAQVEGRATREHIAELERELAQARRRWWRRSKAGE